MFASSLSKHRTKDNLTPKKHKTVTIGLSYNAEVGGMTANSIKQVIKNLGQHLVDIDYREIIPETSENIEDIHNDTYLKISLLSVAKKLAADKIKNLDALIIPGNSLNIDPRFYGEAKTTLDPIDIPRSLAEMALIHVARQRGIPILVICGGHQIAHAYFGTKLKPLSEDEIKDQPIRAYAPIVFNPDSEIAKIFFKEGFTEQRVSDLFFGSHHEVVNKESWQILEFCRDYFNLAATAVDKNNNIEAIESKFGAPFYSLQFHPEVACVGLADKFGASTEQPFMGKTVDQRDINARIFQALIKAAFAYHQRKSTHKIIHFLNKENENNKSSPLPSVKNASIFKNPSCRTILLESNSVSPSILKKR